jgi:hypothetical protein
MNEGRKELLLRQKTIKMKIRGFFWCDIKREREK